MENTTREYDQKIEFLEKKISDLEKRNADLHECLLKNVEFSTQLSSITYEMDCLLVKKGEISRSGEIHDLVQKLAFAEPMQEENGVQDECVVVKEEILSDCDIEMTDHGLEIAESAEASWNPKNYVQTLAFDKLQLERDSNGYFQCPECDYKNSHLGTYEMHFRIHSGEKPYQCQLCEKTFRTKSHCIDHVRTHDDRLKLKCTICDAKFTRSEKILKHTEKMHNGEGYTRKKRKHRQAR